MIYEFICEGQTTISALNNKIPGSSQIIKSLLGKKLIETSTRKKERGSIQSNVEPEWTTESPLQLNKDQDKCYRVL